MKKVIFRLSAVLLVILFLAGYFVTRPSGDIDDYKTYFADDRARPANGSVKVTFFGVSTLLIDDGETQVLIDGFFTRPSLLSGQLSKVSTDEKVVDEMLNRFKVDRLKAIFVTHSHYDHAFDVAYSAQKTNAHLYGSISSLNIARGGGLKEAQMSLFEPRSELQFGKFTVTVIPSKHAPTTSFNNDIGQVVDKPLSQPAKIRDYKEGGTFDFLIKHDGHSIFIKPSANYVAGALDSLHAEVVFLGAGGIGRQPDSFKEKYYAETVAKLRPKLVVPLHWDDFFKPYSEKLKMMSKFMDNTPGTFQFLIAKTKGDNIDFKILQGGKSVVLFGGK